MRPLPTSPTNTFQSPKVATRAGFAASSVFPDLGAALAAGLVRAAAGAERAPTAQPAATANPTARRDESTRLVINSNPLSRVLAFGHTRAAGFPCRPIRAKFRLSPCRRGQGLQSC